MPLYITVKHDNTDSWYVLKIGYCSDPHSLKYAIAAGPCPNEDIARQRSIELESGLCRS